MAPDPARSLFGDPLDDGLSDNERKVMDFITRAAAEGRELESNEEITHQLGYNGGGFVPNVMRRLEHKGLISVKSFQRGRRVRINATGEWTGKPPCQVPHWREVHAKSQYSGTPTLPQPTVRQVPTVMMEVERLMRELSLTFPNAQIMLMSYGVSAIAAEREQD